MTLSEELRRMNEQASRRILPNKPALLICHNVKGSFRAVPGFENMFCGMSDGIDSDKSEVLLACLNKAISAKDDGAGP